MRNFTLAAALGLLSASGVVASPALAQAPAPATAVAKMSVEATDLGTLLDNPASHAVLQKYIAAMINNDQISMARGMTLKQLQQYAGDTITDDVLTKIQADLDKLPAK